MATGRHANVWNLGLEAAGVEMNGNKVKVPLERTKKETPTFCMALQQLLHNFLSNCRIP